MRSNSDWYITLWKEHGTFKFRVERGPMREFIASATVLEGSTRADAHTAMWNFCRGLFKAQPKA